MRQKFKSCFSVTYVYSEEPEMIFFFSFSFGSFVSCGADGRVVCEIYTGEFRPGWMGPWGLERDLVWEDRHNNVYFTIEL